MHNKQYVISIQGPSTETVTFDEAVKGWTSRFSYYPDAIGSLRNNLYTYYKGEVWQHYATNVNYAQFYGINYLSTVDLVINQTPSLVKNFKTINYEGTNGWIMHSLKTDQDVALQIVQYELPTSLSNLENSLFTNNFKKKENKYFANILNVTSIQPGEVLFGQTISGVKGFTAQIKFSSPIDNQGAPEPQTQKLELFAVSSEYNDSSY